MNTWVTQHAINRYRERLFDYTSSPEQIGAKLKEIAHKGKRVSSRPDTSGHCFEVVYRGVAIVLVIHGKRATVLTCLGETAYRKWMKQQDPLTVFGRILYPEEAG